MSVVEKDNGFLTKPTATVSSQEPRTTGGLKVEEKTLWMGKRFTTMVRTSLPTAMQVKDYFLVFLGQLESS